MPLFELPKSSRGQWIIAAVHVLALIVSLAVAWQHDGPPPEKAFWAFLIYFTEIAVAGAIELIFGWVRRSNPVS